MPAANACPGENRGTIEKVNNPAKQTRIHSFVNPNRFL